ncbi:chromosome condensation regulator, partial [Xanthomonas citri pv. citri]|nr:chromosome condensation regulator [Xanthomonas citri pv. citri]
VVVDGGRVLAAGPPGVDECAVAGWSEVVAVAAGNVHGARNTGRSHSVGLRADGTVLAAGWNAHGQCEVTEWTGMVGVAAGWRR